MNENNFKHSLTLTGVIEQQQLIVQVYFTVSVKIQGNFVSV